MVTLKCDSGILAKELNRENWEVKKLGWFYCETLTPPPSHTPAPTRAELQSPTTHACEETVTILYFKQIQHFLV